MLRPAFGPVPGTAPCRVTGWRNRNTPRSRRRRSRWLRDPEVPDASSPPGAFARAFEFWIDPGHRWPGPELYPRFYFSASQLFWISVATCSAGLPPAYSTMRGPEGAGAHSARHQVRAVEAEGRGACQDLAHVALGDRRNRSQGCAGGQRRQEALPGIAIQISCAIGVCRNSINSCAAGLSLVIAKSVPAPSTGLPRSLPS